MKCVSAFSEAFSSHSSPIGAESASFFFLARPYPPKSAEHSGKNGQLFCKTGALSSKSCLVFFRSLGISQFASLSEEKKVREKGEERQHEENKKSGFIERSTAVSNANHFFCYLNKAHPIIYL